MATDAVGFWSYVRDDDTAEHGRVVALSELLRREYELLTGESLELFVDRESLAWGDEWRLRIDGALAGTTFLVPVVTPRFFASRECRRELLSFAGIARSLELEELMMPIYYVSVPELEAAELSGDEAVGLVAQRQREDWRSLRLEDQDSALYRQGINRLAVRLAEVAAEVRERPDTRPVGPRDADQAALEEQELAEPEGMVDLLARGEEYLPKLGPLLNESRGILETVTGAVSAATARLHESDARGQGFAGRLTVSRQLARELEEPAGKLEGFGEAYASLLVNVDPAILTLIRMVEADPDQLESDEVRDLFDSIKQMVTTSRESVANTEEFIRSLEEAASLSRDLRRPLRRIQAGMRGFVDGQSVFDEWERQINRIEADLTPSAGSGIEA